jgi:glycosyltransferase involved in cell wall biosynthesis
VIEEVLPLVGSGVVLDLVGTWPSSTVENAISQNPHVTVRGFVPDLQPFLTEADFVVVALFEGGGTRLKVLEALAAGVPVVASDKAVEGLELGPDLAMWTARTAEDFALSIGSRREPEPVRAAMQRGRDFVEKTYSLNAMVRAIRRTWSS